MNAGGRLAIKATPHVDYVDGRSGRKPTCCMPSVGRWKGTAPSGELAVSLTRSLKAP